MPAGHRFAEPRGRAPGAPPSAAIKYERAESGAHQTIGDTAAEVASFSGYPDSIYLSAQTFGAIFTLQDFMQREICEIHCPPNTGKETFVRARRVLARNCVPASNAIVQVTGKWAERYEAE